MKREELKVIDLLCDMGIDVNGQRNLQPWKAYDIDEVNLVINELQAENERLKKEVADYHQLQWQHDALMDENERLKGENESLKIIDENLREAEENFEKSYIRKLEENQQLKAENAKLKCLALHGMFGFACAKMNVLVEKYNYEFSSGMVHKDFSRWNRLRRLWFESYRKAKAELKEGK